jgi:hypothetical protein
MVSLRNIRDTLEAIAVAHPQINSFDMGDVFDVPGDTQLYPMLWAEPISTLMGSKKVDYSIRIFVMALTDKDGKAELDARSETGLILNDVLILLRRKYELVRDDFSGTAVPFIGKSADEALGWYMDIVIDTPSILGECDVPGSI